jgi:hypothetical protein
MDWFDISYLKHGTKKQFRLYETLIKSNLLNTLSLFTPVVVSTICIGIDINDSDIDIICTYQNFADYKQFIKQKFKTYQHFDIWERKNTNEIVCTFKFDGFLFEIFSSNIPVTQQNAYLHLTAMHKMLSLSNSLLKNKIIEFKKNGLKSEPSFAKLLHLKGDPFEEIKQLACYSNEAILQLIPDIYRKQ